MNVVRKCQMEVMITEVVVTIVVTINMVGKSQIPRYYLISLKHKIGHYSLNFAPKDIKFGVHNH